MNSSSWFKFSVQNLAAYVVLASWACTNALADATDESLQLVDALEKRAIASLKDSSNVAATNLLWKQQADLLETLPPSPKTAYAYARLGFDHRNFVDESALAHNFDIKAMQIYEKEIGVDAPELISVLERLATDALRARNVKLSIELYDRAEKIAEKCFGENDPRVAKLLDLLAERYRGEQQWAKASAAERRAMAIYDRNVEEAQLNSSTSRDKLAESLSAESKLDEAEASYKAAIKTFSHSIGPKSLPVATMLDSLADVYVKEKRFADADKTFKASLTAKSQALGAKSEYLIVTLDKYSDFLNMRGLHAEAASMHKRAEKIRALFPIENRPGVPGY